MDIRLLAQKSRVNTLYKRLKMGKRKLFNIGNLGIWGKKRKLQSAEDKENVCAIFFYLTAKVLQKNIQVAPIHGGASINKNQATEKINLFNDTQSPSPLSALSPDPVNATVNPVLDSQTREDPVPDVHMEPIVEPGASRMPYLVEVDEEDEEDDDECGNGEIGGNEPVEEEEEEEDEEEEEEKKPQFVPPPTLESAQSALTDIKNILRPPRKTGNGYKDPDLSDHLRGRLEGMRMFLWKYCDAESGSQGGHGSKWTAASLDTAHSLERGPYYARKLREWTHEFIADRNEVPESQYGSWSKSIIDDEDISQEINLHLQGLGRYIKGMDIVHFLDTPEMLARLKRKKTISLATAQRWLQKMGYRWTKDPKGQFVDGHERADVVDYRQKTFLPAWSEIEERTRKWTQQNLDTLSPSERRTVVWFHDESTFYANDRRKTRWVHISETAVPYAKGEGASLMVADFVSADYGWLRSPDGKEQARVLFKAGKARDGYFTNDDIIKQAEKAMDILEKHFPDEDHVLVFDNATTHLKRADGALSARKMPKGISKPETNFGVEVPVTAEDGKPVYGPDGKVLKQKVPMSNGTFADGTEQEFYFPEGHEKKGLFKGMGIILEERGFKGTTGPGGLKAQCGKNFSCKPGATDCCCRRILYNQPDFVNVESILETTCKARGFRVLFLPKFHCELNFIEQCWGYAKRRYRLLPPSSKEEDLEKNLVLSLEEVTVIQMRK